MTEPTCTVFSERVSVIETSDGVCVLLVDGAPSSSFDPRSPLTHSVWDAIAAPLALIPRERRRRVLLLGLGGGTVARLVRALAPDAQIVGVEAEGAVVEAARRFFALDALRVEVVIGDARAYLEGAAGDAFDLIVDDLFTGDPSALRKPEWLLTFGLDAVGAMLARDGIFAVNTVEERAVVAEALRARYEFGVAIAAHDCRNRVLVASHAPLGVRSLRRALRAEPLLHDSGRDLSIRTLGARAQ